MSPSGGQLHSGAVAGAATERVQTKAEDYGFF